MNIEEVKSLCKQLPGVTEDIKWVVIFFFSVGRKNVFGTRAEDNTCYG